MHNINKDSDSPTFAQQIMTYEERERERVRKDSRTVEVKRKHLGKSERRFISEGEKEHLVRRYPGNARSSF
jgi:hypothetical protein